MDTYGAMFSASDSLNEQIARQVFDALPDRGPIVAIMDRAGHCRSSNPEELAKLNLGEALLADLRAKVDDGAEPAFTYVGDTGITVAQLATETTGCGYLLIATPRRGAEPTQIHLDLVESLMSQISLVATLVERNCVLNEIQAKYLGACRTGEAARN